MRSLSIHFAQPGMVLAEDLSLAGQELEAGTELTQELLAELKQTNIRTVTVEDTYTNPVQNLQGIGDQVRQYGSTAVQKIFANNSLLYDEVAFNTGKILDEVLRNYDVASSMAAIHSFDTALFERAIQSCVIGVALGKRCKVDFKDLKKLAIGLLLHDIGHLMLPLELLNKPGKLSPEEYQLIQSHVEHGVDLLKSLPTLSPVSRIVVIQHHERFNGTGYPRGLKGDEIHLFGQIAAIADFYTALTTDRPYRKRYYPHEVLEYYMGNGNIHFNYNLVIKFLELIPAFSVGSILLLSNGEEAVVVKVDMKDPFHRIRPRIRLLESQQELELAQHPTLTVFKVLS